MGFFPTCNQQAEILMLLLFFFLAVPRGSWNLSSPTRDGTQALGSESTESCRVLTTGLPGNSLQAEIFTEDPYPLPRLGSRPREEEDLLEATQQV